MKSYDNDINSCLEVLNKGGLILYPTDTIWGIGCDATNEKAVAKTYALKKRNLQKSMVILLAEENNLLKYVTNPDLAVVDYIKGTTKPTTIIYSGARGIAKNLINEDGSIAIRIIKDPFCFQLIKQFQKPVVSTSANIGGYPPPGIFTDIDSAIKKGVDYIVQHRQDDLHPALPSSIIRWNVNGIPTIIRN